MPESEEKTLALFIDFDNVAVGMREIGQRFDVQPLMQRLLEKGRVIARKAYADWSRYKEEVTDLHEAGIELIEIPMPSVSGKNSADIRLVVDAMELCYAKAHLDLFVIVSGDSDFSPLVSKLRENNKSVIGVGVRQSTSRLLVANCDEFIFYDDLVRIAPERDQLADVPPDKRKLFDFLLTTIRGLIQDGRERLYSSLIKDTMKRKRPDFNEANYGYGTFGDLLEDAMQHNLLTLARNERAGGTWIVTGIGPEAPTRARSRRPRRRRSTTPATGAATSSRPKRG